MTQKTKFGLCERIQAAQSVEEIGALLRELDSYKGASQKTRSKATRIARKLSNKLSFGK